MKTFRSIFMICIFALLNLAKSNVYAAEYYGNFQYEESEDSIAIYSYNGADKVVSIPAYIKEKPVTEIKDYAFLLCNSVEKIIVPSTVKTIGANAFSGASNLKEVVLASEDTKIEEDEKYDDQGKQGETGNQKETGAQGEQKETTEQTDRKENVTGNTDNPQTEDGTLDNNKPDYEVSVDPKVDTADDEKAGTNGKDTNGKASNESNTKDTDIRNSDGNDKGVSGTNDEIAGIDEGIDDESENNQDNIEENTNTSSKTGENESNIGKDNIKSEKTMIWLVVGGVLLVCAGIGFVIWRKKRK